MRYPILVAKITGLKEFIDFWINLYTDQHQDLYESTIKHKRFKRDDILKLYEWKNGGPLSRRQRSSVKRIIKKIRTINRLKQKMDPNVFEKIFGNLSADWKLFLYHIIKPRRYPLFDRHVFRAFHHLKYGTVNELVDNDKTKNAVYAEYTMFFRDILKKDVNAKSLDKALWVFGKFLKSDYAECL